VCDLFVYAMWRRALGDGKFNTVLIDTVIALVIPNTMIR
jgi:hypothetical protein